MPKGRVLHFSDHKIILGCAENNNRANVDLLIAENCGLSNEISLFLTNDGDLAEYSSVYFGINKNVGYIRGIFDFKISLAINSAVGHIVDNIAEGRNVKALAGVNLDYEDISLTVAEGVGKIEGEGGIATVMLADFLAVKKDLRIVGDALEGEKNALSLPFGLGIKSLAISRNRLILILGEVVKGELLCSMRDSYALDLRTVKLGVVEIFIKIVGKLPIIIYINP
jgi:hypothetical protein